MKKLSDTKKLDCVTNVRNDSIRHAELVSASQFVILSVAKNLNLPLTLALSLKGRGKMFRVHCYELIDLSS